MKKESTPFTLRKLIIEYPQLVQARDRIRQVHEASQLSGKGRGIALLGPSGVGKTTVLEEYMRSFKSSPRSPGSKPIIFVEVPSTPTPKSLGAAVLDAMGDKFAHRGSAEEKQFRIVVLLKGLQTELVVFDEAQHLVEIRRTPTGATTDWLKNLLNKSRVAVVLAGLKRTEELLFSNEQLRRRFSATAYYDRFDIEKPGGAQSFGQLLKSFHELLPVPTLSFVNVDMVQRFYHASFGLIDYLIMIVDRAVLLAQQSKVVEIDLAILAQAFRDEVWSLSPDKRNPFSSKFNWEPLIGKCEPFEDFDSKAA